MCEICNQLYLELSSQKYRFACLNGADIFNYKIKIGKATLIQSDIDIYIYILLIHNIYMSTMYVIMHESCFSQPHTLVTSLCMHDRRYYRHDTLWHNNIYSLHNYSVLFLRVLVSYCCPLYR